MGQPTRKLLGQKIRKIPLVVLDEDDLHGSFGLPVVELCPGCVNTLAQGFTPLTDAGYIDDFSGNPTYWSHSVTSNAYEINGTVPGNVSTQASFGFFGYDPVNSPKYTGDPPTQLHPCKHAFKLNFDYTLEIVSPSSDSIRFILTISAIADPNSVGFIPGGNTGVIIQTGTGMNSGSLELNIPAETVACHRVIALSIEGNSSLNDTSGVSDKTAHLLIENFVLTDLGV